MLPNVKITEGQREELRRVSLHLKARYIVFDGLVIKLYREDNKFIMEMGRGTLYHMACQFPKMHTIDIEQLLLNNN